MALPMPRLFRHKSGVYHLNVRLSSDAAPKLRGATVLVPIGDATVSAKLTDKAFISLRTKEPDTAKSRFGAAFEALTRQLDALRTGPRSLPFKQVVALAGQVYRDRVARDEVHPDLGPEHLAGQIDAWADVIRELRETQDPVDTLENGPLEADPLVLRFPNTKDGNARLVPILEELETEGFLEFVAAAPVEGLFFAGDQPQKPGSSRTQPEQRASELAGWVRKQARLPPEVCPNHGWRHTWCTLAEEAGAPKRFSNAISGHNKNRDVSDGSVTPSVRQLRAEMAKFPRFDLTGTTSRA